MNNTNYNDIRKTFLKLVDKTHPHSTEEDLLNILPQLEKDEFGNYYKVVGDKPSTMFNSHLDNYGKEQVNTNPFVKNIEGNDYVFSTNTILGADDKAGVTLMLYMIERDVVGLYYFFIGEEVGVIGSSALSNSFDSNRHLDHITKCVSFDRRGIDSIVTHQSKERCCSDVFANRLKDAFLENGLKFNLDDSGVYSDSASFIGKIKECTNISVGYYNEHTTDEKQNISFLESLASACVSIDWEGIPIGNISENLKYMKSFNSFKKVKLF